MMHFDVVSNPSYDMKFYMCWHFIWKSMFVSEYYAPSASLNIFISRRRSPWLWVVHESKFANWISLNINHDYLPFEKSKYWNANMFSLRWASFYIAPIIYEWDTWAQQMDGNIYFILELHINKRKRLQTKVTCICKCSIYMTISLVLK